MTTLQHCAIKSVTATKSFDFLCAIDKRKTEKLTACGTDGWSLYSGAYGQVGSLDCKPV